MGTTTVGLDNEDDAPSTKSKKVSTPACRQWARSQPDTCSAAARRVFQPRLRSLAASTVLASPGEPFLGAGNRRLPRTGRPWPVVVCRTRLDRCRWRPPGIRDPAKREPNARPSIPCLDRAENHKEPASHRPWSPL